MTGANCSSDTLWDALEEQASKQPDKIAYRILDSNLRQKESITYQVLRDRAAAVAVWIDRRGYSRRPVALTLPTGIEFIVNFFGVLRGGGAVLPLNPKLTLRGGEDLERIAEESGVAAIVSERTIVERLQQQSRNGSCLPALLRTSLVDDASEAIETRSPPEAQRSEPAVIQYTSGSTSAPKGVRVTHANFLSNARALTSIFAATSDDVAVSWLPLFHDMGLMTALVWPVTAGASGILMKPSIFAGRPASWLRAMSEFGGTISAAPNFAYQMCVDRIGEEEAACLNLSTWRVAINGAEPVSADTIEQFVDRFAPARFDPACFFPSYGLAEATLFVSGGRAHAPPRVLEVDAYELETQAIVQVSEPGKKLRKVVSCGLPAPNIDVAIVSPLTREPLAERRVGEIWIRGASISPGYLGRPDLNAATFGGTLASIDGPPFLRTGDLGFLEGGDLFVVGRIKDLIIVRGQNYAPQDIESTSGRSHPVFEGGKTVAFNLEGDEKEAVVVLQEVRSGLHPDLGVALEALRIAVALEHGIALHAIVLLPQRSLPLTSSGKVRRAPSKVTWLEGGFEVVASWGSDRAATSLEARP